MGETDLKYVDQRLRARIKKSAWVNSWYHSLVGKRFEVERNPSGLKLIESEAVKVRELLGDLQGTAYYIKENECSLVKIEVEPKCHHGKSMSERCVECQA